MASQCLPAPQAAEITLNHVALTVGYRRYLPPDVTLVSSLCTGRSAVQGQRALVLPLKVRTRENCGKMA